MRATPGACIKPGCLARRPLCHKANLPASCEAQRLLCHRVNPPSCVARRPLFHKVNGQMNIRARQVQSRTRSTRTASPGRINSDRLGSNKKIKIK